MHTRQCLLQLCDNQQACWQTGATSPGDRRRAAVHVPPAGRSQGPASGTACRRLGRCPPVLHIFVATKCSGPQQEHRRHDLPRLCREARYGGK